MPFILKAQITITQADFANLGDVVIQATDTLPLPAINAGSPGANQTWDFSLLHNHYSNTFTFVNPATTPFASSFPTANLSFSFPGPFYNYLNSSATSVQLLGFGGNLLGDGTQHAMVYSNPEKMIVFPCTYNTPVNDTSIYDKKFYYGHLVNVPPFGNVMIDSVRQKQVNYITGSIDAWGTAITPDGSFPVLRSNSMKYTRDTTWGHSQLYNIWVIADTNSTHTQSYGFLANGIDFVLLNITCYPSSNIIDYVDWTRATPVSVNENNDRGDVSIYPNPASDYINLNNVGYDNVYAVIYDVEGREIIKTSVVDDMNTISVSNLKEGVYVLKLLNDSGILKTQKLLISHY